MSITVQSEPLAEALKQGVAVARSPMPLLGFARLRMHRGSLHVDTTDSEAWVSSQIEAENVGEADDFAILIRDDLLRPVAAPGAGAIIIHADGKVRSKRGRYSLPVQPANDFVDLEDAEWSPLTIDTGDLAQALGVAGHAASDADVRPMCKSVNVCPGRVWSTDAVLIAQMALEYTGPRLAIPPKQVSRLIQALEQDAASIDVANVRGEVAGLLRVRGPRQELCLRLMQAPAFNMDGYLRDVMLREARLVLPVTDLASALRRFLPFIQFGMGAGNKAIPTAELQREGDVLVLRDRSGEASEQIPFDPEAATGGDWRVAFDVKRMQSALANLGSGSIALYPSALQGNRADLIAIVPAGADILQCAQLLAPARL